MIKSYRHLKGAILWWLIMLAVILIRCATIEDTKHVRSEDIQEKTYIEFKNDLEKG